MLTEENDIEDFFKDEQVLLGPVVDEELGVLIQLGFSERITSEAFKAIFFRELGCDPTAPDSEFPHIVKGYLSHGMTQDEAERKATALCDRATQGFAFYAYKFFRRNIQSKVIEAIALLKTQAISHAKIVLDKTSVSDDEGLCVINFTGVDPKLLRDQTLAIAEADVKRLHDEAKKDRQELLIAHAPSAFEPMLRLFEQIKDYHDEQRAIFFNGPRPRNDPANNEAWVKSWLKLARAKYGKEAYQSRRTGALLYLSDEIFRKFADQSTDISNPMKITQGFIGDSFDMSGEYFRKTIFAQIPLDQKPKRNRKKRVKQVG